MARGGLSQQLGAPGGAELRVRVPRPDNAGVGHQIIWANTIVTIVWLAIGIGSQFADALVDAYVVASAAMFFVGLALMTVAIVAAARRSRDDQLDVIGVFLVTRRVAATRPQAVLSLTLVTQALAGLVFAGLAPFTLAATGTLTWVFGLGSNGLWAANYGSFPAQIRGDDE
jgi:hypothetical protein